MAIVELKGKEADGASGPAARRSPQATRLGGAEAPVVPAAPTPMIVLKACAKCTAVLSVSEDAGFCPSCGGNLKATTAQVVSEIAPAAPAPRSPVQSEVQQQPAPVARAAMASPAPTPVVARGKRRKTARTLFGEAETEGRRFAWFLLVMGLAALIAGIVWLVTSHRRPQPEPLPVSTMPISVMPYDAGTD